MAKDYYKILGVSRDASRKDIRIAHAAKLRPYHPDFYKGDPAEVRPKIDALNEAWSVLGDEGKRREYDHLYPHAGLEETIIPESGPNPARSSNRRDVIIPGRELAVPPDEPRDVQVFTRPNGTVQTYVPPQGVGAAPPPPPRSAPPPHSPPPRSPPPGVAAAAPKKGIGRILAILAAVAAAAGLYALLHHKKEAAAPADTSTATAPASVGPDEQAIARERSTPHVDYYLPELGHPELKSENGGLHLHYTGSTPTGGTYTQWIPMKGWQNCAAEINSPQDKLIDGNDKVFYCNPTPENFIVQEGKYTTDTRFRIHESSPSTPGAESPNTPASSPGMASIVKPPTAG